MTTDPLTTGGYTVAGVPWMPKGICSNSYITVFKRKICPVVFLQFPQQIYCSAHYECLKLHFTLLQFYTFTIN